MFQVRLIFALKHWQNCCPPGILHQRYKIALYNHMQGDFLNLQPCMYRHEDIKKWYGFIAMYMNIHADIQHVVHYITMHINMHSNITTHA